LASSSHSFHEKKNHAYLYVHVKNASNVAHHDAHDVLPRRRDVVFDSHAMLASSSSSDIHGRSRPKRHVHQVSHAPKNASNGPTILYRTYDASYVLHCKNDKVVARNVGPKCKGGNACVWVPKFYVTNLVGPNKSWVPKSQASITLQVYASGGTSWIIDSGCTNHMTGEKKVFTSYVKNKDSQDTIIFGDGNQGKVKGLGKIAVTTEHSISNVFLVESIGYNLLSISQLCHMGYSYLFTNIETSAFRRSDDPLAFKGVLDGKLYLVDFAKENVELDTCLIAKTNLGWLWHRRLAYVGMKNLHKLLKGEHVLGLTDV
jgi:hypothetical protein